MLDEACYKDHGIFIFDLDGTIADSRHRHHFLQDVVDGVNVPKKKKDWVSFFAAQEQDVPHEAVRLLLKALWQCGEIIIILTARPEDQRKVSEIWLNKYGVEYDALLMRPVGCREDDNTLKVRQLKKYFTEEQRARIKTIFEDRRRIVTSLRAEGYHVCHVDEGDF